MPHMTEEKVRAIVAEQMREMLGELQDSQASIYESVIRIENGLYGNPQMKELGLVEKANTSYEYVRKNIESDLVKEGWNTINFVKQWERAGNWGLLLGMIDSYKIWKWLTAFVGFSTLISIINLVDTIAKIIK